MHGRVVKRLVESGYLTIYICSLKINVLYCPVGTVHNLLEVSQEPGVLQHVMLHGAGLHVVALLAVVMALGEADVHLLIRAADSL